MTMVFLTLLTTFVFCIKHCQCGSQPNPPTWPSGISVFDPADPTSSQTIIDNAFTNNGGMSPSDCNGEWSEDRYAFLFLQGTHNVNVPIGYYTTIHGLGMLPTDVIIEEVSVADCSNDYTVGALDNFWRSAENFEMTPSTTYNNLDEATMLWAVSQASPLRRVVINGGLSLYEYTGGDAAGYASGGFIADVKVSTSIYSGSQQQFIARNVDIATSWEDGVWNMVLVGCDGNLPSNDNSECHPFTIVDETPLIAEKPFIYYDSDSSNYSIIVPQVETNKIGAASNWGSNYDAIDFTNVYIASPDNNDSSESINSMLTQGYSILFAPGLYNLTNALIVSHDDTIILGIGFPTIECGHDTGDPCIVVGDSVTGVRITGLLLQAGPAKYNTLSLLQMGSNSSEYKYSAQEKKFAKRLTNIHFQQKSFNIVKDKYTSQALGTKKKKKKDEKKKRDGGIRDGSGYNFIMDVFGRVGGTNDPSDYQVSSTYMFDINMDNVLIDDTWLWRADHDSSGDPVSASDNPVITGFEVNGDNVIAYGLAVEHTLGNLVEWNGNGGECYFYQSEFPYDVTQDNYGDLGYVSYKVGDQVTSHAAYGVGAYSYFRDYVVTVDSGFSCPSSGSTFTDALTVFLNGNGGISHVVNSEGNAVNSTNGQSYLCSF